MPVRFWPRALLRSVRKQSFEVHALNFRTFDEPGEAGLLARRGIGFDDARLTCLIDCGIGRWEQFLSFDNLFGSDRLNHGLGRIIERVLAAHVENMLLSRRADCLLRGTGYCHVRLP